MTKINIEKKFNLFSDYWNPRIIAEVNEQYIKIAKVKGEFVWHEHLNEDEMFMVIKGQLFIRLESETIELNKNEIYVVPKRIAHQPYAKEECWLLLFEPKCTLHTGINKTDLTNNEQEYL